MSDDALQLLSQADLDHLSQLGISSEEAAWQLRQLLDPPPPARLVRPATVGDGIERLSPERQAQLERSFTERAPDAIKFVPASGAASRMFKELLAEWQGETPSPEAPSAGQRLLDGRDHWPFPTWQSTGDDELSAALEQVLSGQALGLPTLPKGLLPFHRRVDGSAATAFEDQLHEGALHLNPASGSLKFHFTVSDQHEERFRAELGRVRAGLEQEFGATFDVSFSQQSAATDTLAISPDGDLMRDDDGLPLLRPGGHGALLTNLDALDAECVFVKNIDNIQPPHRQTEVARWKRVLGGRLGELTDRSHRLAERVDQVLGGGPGLAEAVAETQSFLADTFGLPPDLASAPAGEEVARQLLTRLERPVRVCGVVPNTGEPGGGPFWTHPEDPGLQIVESAEIAEDQMDLLEAGSHFNPVDLALCTRDRHGRSYDLQQYVDRQRVFVARKSAGGRDLLALERPGLWNGSMAFWNTVFVEVPIETFAPVKTLFDLLKPQHQPAG